LANVLVALAVVGALIAGPSTALGQEDGPEIGKKAPEFSLVDLDGNTHKLSDYKGKIVVLEWFHPTSTYVVDQYTNHTLKTFGNALHKKPGVVYLAINSTATGKAGSDKDENVAAKKRFGMNFPILLDADGKTADAYKARFTPHMYVIDGQGNLRYMGAIDNAPLGKVNASYPTGKSGQAGAVVNYVQQAIDEIENDETVTTPKTKPYGSRIAR
jgi:peroxiredoxin